MIKTIKRFFIKQASYKEAYPYLCEIRPVLNDIFNGVIKCVLAGGRGKDVIFLIKKQHSFVGVLRISHQKQTKISCCINKMPYEYLSAEDKINRERIAYEKGHILGLTPKPLWWSSKALLCEYIKGYPLMKWVHTKIFLQHLSKALPFIKKMHAINITHMDMSPANILVKEDEQYVFVDFEYGANLVLSFEQQCLYDYLRLLESSWKFLSLKDKKEVFNVFGKKFLEIVPDDVKRADIRPLKPALMRILEAEELKEFFNCFLVENKD